MELDIAGNKINGGPNSGINTTKGCHQMTSVRERGKSALTEVE
jgi:hypothetical protein